MDANRPLRDDDDLLTPSLSAQDDAVGFDRPWNPAYLVLLGAFIGIIPAGLMFAENFRRLGRPALRTPIIVGAVLLGLAATLLATYLHLRGWPGLYDAGSTDHKRVVRLSTQGTAIVLGLVFASMQRPRWEIHAGHGGESASFWRPALGTTLLAFGLQMAVALPFAAWVKGGAP